MLDPVWIPIVAKRGWLIVTRDSRIQTHRAEIDAVMSNRARMVALASPDARGKWQQMETLMRNWQRIEALGDVPGPFIYRATFNGLRSIALT